MKKHLKPDTRQQPYDTAAEHEHRQNAPLDAKGLVYLMQRKRRELVCFRIAPSLSPLIRRVARSVRRIEFRHNSVDIVLS